MVNAFYAAKAGAGAYQGLLNITADNLANANTDNYKAQRASFGELLETTLPGTNITVGSGSRIASVYRDMSSGSYIYEEGRIEAMIAGDGFFAVQDRFGNQAFTRAGSVNLSSEGDRSYIVTASGQYYLDHADQRIEAPNGLDPMLLQSMALYRFENAEGLVPQGDGLYAMSAASGAAVADTESRIILDASETSNVDVMTEMVNLIQAQRGFQYSVRMLQTADEIEQTVNSLRT